MVFPVWDSAFQFRNERAAIVVAELAGRTVLVEIAAPVRDAVVIRLVLGHFIVGHDDFVHVRFRQSRRDRNGEFPFTVAQLAKRCRCTAVSTVAAVLVAVLAAFPACEVD